MEGMTSRIQIRDDRVETPISVSIDDVSAITVAKQIRIEAGVVGPRPNPGPDTNIGSVRGVHLATIAC